MPLAVCTAPGIHSFISLYQILEHCCQEKQWGHPYSTEEVGSFPQLCLGISVAQLLGSRCREQCLLEARYLSLLVKLMIISTALIEKDKSCSCGMSASFSLQWLSACPAPTVPILCSAHSLISSHTAQHSLKINSCAILPVKGRVVGSVPNGVKYREVSY